MAERKEGYVVLPWHGFGPVDVSDAFALRLHELTGCLIADRRNGRLIEPESLSRKKTAEVQESTVPTVESDFLGREDASRATHAQAVLGQPARTLEGRESPHRSQLSRPQAPFGPAIATMIGRRSNSLNSITGVGPPGIPD